jgi:hypothetical protein
MKIKQYILTACSLWMMVNVIAQPADSLQQVANTKDSLLRIELKQAKYKLYQALLHQQSTYQVHADAGSAVYNLGTPLSVELTDTAFQFVCANKMNAALHFSYLTDLKIKIYHSNSSIQGNSNVSVSQLKVGGIIFTVSSEQQYILNPLRQQFITIQRLYNDLQFNVHQFEVLVAVHLSSIEKPMVTEKQRKLILQADAATKLFQYEKSIWLNKAIIRLHPTAYHNVYRNIAVLQGETNRLHSAIYNMKRFLLFNPEKDDADFAKTKINEWEIILSN